jgi:sec-independent protein translocase protein TatB
MFDIAWGEFVVIAVVALIVIGPKELPGVLRAIGQWTTKIRRMATEFQGQFQEALREAEMADLKKEVDNLNDAARGFTSQFDDPLNLKEATKWEPKPDAAQTPPDPPKAEEGREGGYISPDDAAKPADGPPQSASTAPDPPAPSHAGDEAFPIPAAPPATAQTSPPVLVSAPDGGGNGGGAASAAAAPPAAQPSPLPEGSSQRRDEGGVHP